MAARPKREVDDGSIRKSTPSVDLAKLNDYEIKPEKNTGHLDGVTTLRPCHHAEAYSWD
jgi:hypothetical protein